MATIADELNAISVEHGYTGAAPKTIAGAIDALADTLAGADVEERRSIAGAVKALAPYIGTGGGAERVELFNETVTTTEDAGGHFTAKLAFTGDITDDPLVVVFDGTEYKLPKSEKTDDVGNKFVVYGATSMGPTMSDFSTYPLSIQQSRAGWKVYTETAGTHTIVAYVKPMPIPELGRLHEWPRCFSMTGSTPTVGDNIKNFSPVFCSDLTLSVGMSAAVHCDPNQDDYMPTIASGVSIAWDPAINDKSLDDFRAAYAISVSDDMTITAMRELEGFTVGSRTISFTMPELAEGERLYIYFYARSQ